MKLIIVSIVFATILVHHLSIAAPALKRDARSIENTTECVIIVGVKKVKQEISRHAKTVKEGIHTGLNHFTSKLFKKKPEPKQQQQHPDDEYKGLDYAIDVRILPDTDNEQRQKRDAEEEVTEENNTQGNDSDTEEVIDAVNKVNPTFRRVLMVPSFKKSFVNGRNRDLIFD